MATIVVSFDSEKEAQETIRRLTEANLGTVRARILDSSDPSSDTEDMQAPMITGMGTIDVRPTDSPSVPEARTDDIYDEASGAVPTTGNEPHGVQVQIEMDDEKHDQIMNFLKKGTGGSKKP